MYLVKFKSFFVLLLLCSLFFSCFFIVPVSASWWDTDWDYYKTITVSNKINNYQTFINISKDDTNDINCNNHCNDDFSDIRFVYNNATELPYWIETFVSGSYALVWVKNSGNYDSFEMFYGNSGASTTGNGTNTFDFYEDWDSETIDSKWTIQYNDGSYSFDDTYANHGSVLDISGGSSTAREVIKTVYQMDDPFRMKTRTYMSSNSVYPQICEIGISDYAVTNPLYTIQSYQSLSRTRFRDGDSTTTHTDYNSAQLGLNAYTTYTFDMDISVGNLSIYVNEALLHNEEYLPMASTLSAWIYVRNNAIEMYCDWIFMSKFSSTEPSFSTGSEVPQSSGWSNTAPTLSNESPTGTGVSLNTDFSITVTDADGNSSTVYWKIDTDSNVNDTSIVNTNSSVLNQTAYYNASSEIDTYNEVYYVGVWANDSHDNSSFYWSFTTIDYTPNAPASMSASADSDVQITIAWTDDTDADSTRLEWAASADGSWNVGDHTLLQNDSSESYVHGGLDCGEDYFYKAWSWNSTQGVWSSGSTDNATTSSCPVWYNHSFGGVANVTLTPSISCLINCSSGDNWDEVHFIDWTLGATSVGYTYQYNVSEDNQTDLSRAALNITNTGNVALNFSIMWESDPNPAFGYVAMKYNTTDSAPNPGDNNVSISPSSTQFITNLAPTDFEEIWLWMDFVGVASGGNGVNVTITYEQYVG